MSHIGVGAELLLSRRTSPGPNAGGGIGPGGGDGIGVFGEKYFGIGRVTGCLVCCALASRAEMHAQVEANTERASATIVVRRIAGMDVNRVHFCACSAARSVDASSELAEPSKASPTAPPACSSRLLFLLLLHLRPNVVIY